MCTFVVHVFTGFINSPCVPRALYNAQFRRPTLQVLRGAAREYAAAWAEDFYRVSPSENNSLIRPLALTKIAG
jgi:hypothetical protein